MKIAKDGSRRGRPPLFGEAGHYERVYADVPREVADRIRAEAVERRVSIASVLLPILESEEGWGRLSLVEGGCRIYIQIGIRTARRLKAEAVRRDCPLSHLLGSMAAVRFGPRKIAN